MWPRHLGGVALSLFLQAAPQGTHSQNYSLQGLGILNGLGH